MHGRRKTHKAVGRGASRKEVDHHLKGLLVIYDKGFNRLSFYKKEAIEIHS